MRLQCERGPRQTAAQVRIGNVSELETERRKKLFRTPAQILSMLEAAEGVKGDPFTGRSPRPPPPLTPTSLTSFVIAAMRSAFSR